MLKHCTDVVEKRFSKIKQTIADIEESLTEESKSTAGDKHETGRAMLQIDRENAGKQLQEVEKLQQLIRKIDINSKADYARLGSLVYTNQATYFISISIGAVTVGKSTYLCLTFNSPIGQLLSGKKIGDTFTFNDKTLTIKSVS